MFDVALSTMWAIGRFPSLAEFYAAAREMGFSHVELNHSIDSAMLDCLPADAAVASIHEPCPADISMRTLKEQNWLISAPDEEDRRRGVDAVHRSIDLAHRLGARLLVVHPGRVDIDPALEEVVLALYRAGQDGRPEYVAARQRLVAARAAQAEINMRSARRSLLELAEHAARVDVRLGLENRFHYPEIPLPDELEDLLSLGAGPVVGYWHDVGHAHVLEQLGLGTHEEWLRRFAPRIVGMHLHDVRGIADHKAAGLGGLDWDLVARYLPAGGQRTCEFLPANSPEQVAAGLAWLAERGLVANGRA